MNTKVIKLLLCLVLLLWASVVLSADDTAAQQDSVQQDRTGGSNTDANRDQHHRHQHHQHAETISDRNQHEPDTSGPDDGAPVSSCAGGRCGHDDSKGIKQQPQKTPLNQKQAASSPSDSASQQPKPSSSWSVLSCDKPMQRAMLDILFGAGTVCPPEALPEQRKLEVLLAGLPRAGSASLKIALERLGYRAVHGTELMQYPVMLQALQMHNARVLVEETERQGYNAALEVHAALFPGMFQERPDAKVILLKRDFDTWYQAYSDLVKNALGRYPLRFLFWQAADIGDHICAGYMDDVDIDCAFGRGSCGYDNDEHRAFLKTRIYDHMYARTRALVPKNQLLELDLKAGEGYKELCAFLDVSPGDCPDEKFPRGNTRDEVAQMVYVTNALEMLCYVALIAIVVLCTWRIARRFRG